MLHIARNKCLWVEAVSGVRPEAVDQVFASHGEYQLLTNVPVALAVEVHEPQIVPVNLTQEFARLEHLPCQEILRLLLNVAHFVPAGDAILLICKFHFAYYLMIKSAHEGIVEHVALIIKGDFASIFKGDRFESLNLELDGV